MFATPAPVAGPVAAPPVDSQSAIQFVPTGPPPAQDIGTDRRLNRVTELVAKNFGEFVEARMQEAANARAVGVRFDFGLEHLESLLEEHAARTGSNFRL